MFLLFRGSFSRAILGAGLSLALLLASSVSADVFNLGGVRNPVTGQWTGTASLEVVPVGNPNNAADTNGRGSVSYGYNVGKYEVTAGQYTMFLNAVAATDTYSLYNSDMANTAYGSGITRSGSSGSYIYDVNPALVNRPVGFVSFWDACRFTNWLNNGQGGAGTTEYGAYTFDGVVSPFNTTITRNSTATWAVISENEWYKAAYYDPSLNSGAGGYWLYPTGSNTPPGRDLADVSGNNANYYGTPYPIQSPYYATLVGEFQNSDSPYGTFDQGGNVAEWNEAIASSLYRVYLGWSFGSGYEDSRHGRFWEYPSFEIQDIGFRVVQIVPEPASLAFLTFGVAAFLTRRQGRK